MLRRENLEFNEEGRKKAGLDPDFVQQLQVYNRSTGRSPNVFVFEPSAENDIAGGTANQSSTVSQLAADLEILIALVSRRDDIALVRQLPRTDISPISNRSDSNCLSSNALTHQANSQKTALPESANSPVCNRGPGAQRRPNSSRHLRET